MSRGNFRVQRVVYRCLTHVSAGVVVLHMSYVRV